MTKEELKNALISHGAPVPPASAKKDEFVQASSLIREFESICAYTRVLEQMLMTHGYSVAITAAITIVESALKLLLGHLSHFSTDSFPNLA